MSLKITYLLSFKIFAQLIVISPYKDRVKLCYQLAYVFRKFVFHIWFSPSKLQRKEPFSEWGEEIRPKLHYEVDHRVDSLKGGGLSSSFKRKSAQEAAIKMVKFTTIELSCDM